MTRKPVKKSGSESSMCEDKKSRPENLSDTFSEAEKTAEQAAREIHIDYDESPTPHWDRQIHPRQKIPSVPEEEERVPDKTPSPPVDID